MRRKLTEEKSKQEDEGKMREAEDEVKGGGQGGRRA